MTSRVDLPVNPAVRSADPSLRPPATQPLAQEVVARPRLLPGRGHWLLVRSLPVLFKARVVLLLLFASVGGLVLATAGRPGIGRLAALLVTGGSAAAGASAINQFLERRLDGRMNRTRQRPLVTGVFAKQGWVPMVGILMILLPSLVALPFNPILTVTVLSGAAIYLGIYTIWLKPRTALNIVVGGLAGSAAVLSGSAAAGAWSDLGALLLALLVFLWTPTHFWSLAIAYRDDYARGGFPMLPVQTTPRAAACWVLLSTGGTALVALALAARPTLGWLYLLPVGLATVLLLVLNVRLIQEPNRRRALTLFHGSNLYLALVIMTVCADVLLGG
jgi:protoheme IX farnesyltransferase